MAPPPSPKRPVRVVFHTRTPGSAMLRPGMRTPPAGGCQAGAMRMFRALLVVSAVAAMAAGVPVTPAPAGAAPAKYPSLVGTWTGTYRFPSGIDTAVDSHETLVIDKQDKELLWGHDQFVQNGQVVHI